MQQNKKRNSKVQNLKISFQQIKPNNGLEQEVEVIEEDRNTFDFSDLKNQQYLANGSQGHVFVYDYGHQKIAVKSMNINTNDSKLIQGYNFEIKTLLQCDNQQIIKCYGYEIKQGFYNVALEFMDLGSIENILKKVEKIPEVIVGLIAFQILNGFNYLHKQQKIIHRDIKPSNILLNSEGYVKLADFGVSGQLQNTNGQKNTWVGTAKYMSPERYLGKTYNSSIDIWSLGLVVIECVTGQYPFKEGRQDTNTNYFDLMDAIIYQDYQFQQLAGFSDKMQDFIKLCLQKDINTRPSSQQLIQHPFVSQYSKLKNNDIFKNWLKNTY